MGVVVRVVDVVVGVMDEGVVDDVVGEGHGLLENGMIAEELVLHCMLLGHILK
jgi:hypothetical protein